MSRLKPLLIFHLTPIIGLSSRDLIPFDKLSTRKSTHLEVGFLLRRYQQLSTPHVATQRFLGDQELVYHRCVLHRSSRTIEGSSQYSSAYTGYGPNCLTHVIPNFHKGMDYVFILLQKSRSWRIIFLLTKKNISKFEWPALFISKSLRGRIYFLD
jgi:hypothetical protein